MKSFVYSFHQGCNRKGAARQAHATSRDAHHPAGQVQQALQVMQFHLDAFEASRTIKRGVTSLETWWTLPPVSYHRAEPHTECKQVFLSLASDACSAF